MKPTFLEKLKPFGREKVSLMTNKREKIVDFIVKFTEDDFLRQYVYETLLKKSVYNPNIRILRTLVGCEG